MKVSIIVPIYNNKDFYKNAVRSAMEQDYMGLIDVIAIDNESTEMDFFEIKTQLNFIAEDFKNSVAPRSLTINQVPNIHKYSWHEPTFAGMEAMKGDIFLFLGSDDYLSQNYVTNCVKIFKANENIKAIQSYVRNFGARHGVDGYLYSNIPEFKEMCLERCPVKTPSLVYHRSLYEDGLMVTHPEKYFGADDYWRVCNLANEGVLIVPIPKWLGYNYQWHDKMATIAMHQDLNSPATIDKEIQAEWREKWEL
jgi:hypothetical protein